MQLHTSLCDTLQIKYPIIQAGMAGGPTTIELVVSVCEAGGLGTLGAAYMSPNDMRMAIRKIKEQTKRPFAVNLFATSMKDDLTNIENGQSVLNSIRQVLKLPDGSLHVQTKDDTDEQFSILLEENVPIISTAFGLLTKKQMTLVKQQHSKVTAMVTTVSEALLAEANGVDVIVAQGSDAGGHRSTFDLTNHPYGATIGTFSLVPQVVDAVNIPVVASGGIMDSRGLRAALALGASGVQMGTQFLTTIESGAHPAYQQALLNSNEESTVVTKSFSGRPARGIKNKFIKEFEAQKVAPLPFPTQNTLTSDIRKAAASQHNSEYMSLWAGQGTRLLMNQRHAKEVIEHMIAGFESQEK
ncbi:NAD(P)H-dependent flavin oxidoreductase [Metabacillus iocasae]|uniref:Probable nitronate monooxygenase n=1 Tax=Priestia iocasae TaxID=2291674 RepID=A0ABS2QW27_9BACI|nr:nitronate monooxygenase family protein [Metabacillus iocasae]MBM7703689.1 nitronate monooxygenase [Metabacillus iocasae]